MGDKQVEMTPWHGDVISVYTCSVLSMDLCFFTKYGYLQVIKQASADRQGLKIPLSFYSEFWTVGRKSSSYFFIFLLKSSNSSVYTSI